MSHFNREKELFDQALDLTDAAEREAFLRRECAHDDALLERLRNLLAAHEHATAFLSQSPRMIATVRDELLGEQPGDRIGRYKLLEKVGEGGCGAVYVAEQTEPVRRRVPAWGHQWLHWARLRVGTRLPGPVIIDCTV